MYCKECGAFIPESSKSCPNCGSPVNGLAASNYSGSQYKICPETHLTKAIILTVLCCWPFGIPAIVYAAGVENAFHSGNYSLAVEKSQKAAKWCNTTLIVGIIFWVLYIIMIIILVATGLWYELV